MKGEMFGKKIFVISVALSVLQITKHTSAQNTTVSSNTTVTPSTSPPTSSSSTPSSTSPTSPSPPSTSPTPVSSQSYLTLPRNLTAELGDPAQFWCGVPKTSEGLTFTFYGHNKNYTLTCPEGHIQDIPQALEGLCIVHVDELLALWVLKGTSLPDDGSRVLCQRRGHPDAPIAHLRVHNNGSGNGLLIGLVVGGFFGVITVCGLGYLMLTKSERLQICFRGKDNQPEDLSDIVNNIEPTATSQPTLNKKVIDL